ncbi:hypothetical protein Scep_010769 [Stephania cephalantha]|uniref:Bifunctional inhibitor/plant lipid transfer protein/seed storage helical domain-containing protein n=1 Tax=Stephania cephalantha TaxID=152367 RepID=A0AAP0JVQ3_9MAGN
MKHALLLVVVVVVLNFVIDSNGAKATKVDDAKICNMTVAELMECKPAAVAPNPPPPTQACCSGLSHGDMGCLCSYKNSPLLPSFGINPTLALQIPAKCGLSNKPPC